MSAVPVPRRPAAQRRAAPLGRVTDRGAWGRRLLIGLVVAYTSVLVLAPIAALIVGALRQGLGPVVATFRQPDVQSALALTVLIALLVVVVHAVGGTAVAWVLVRHRFAGRQWLNALIDLPFSVSPVVVGYMLLLLFGRHGLLHPLLQWLDLKVAFAVPGMVLATLFVTLPFMVREVAPVLAALDLDNEEAAATLGASGWTTFWRVTFPALRWGFIYGMLLTLARALGEFGAVLVIGGGIQGRTETATIYVFRALEERQYVSAYSVALALGVVSLGLVLAADLFRRREG